MKQINPEFLYFNGPSEFSKSITDEISNSSNKYVRQNGRFNIMLAGGQTPRSIYENLAKMPLDWNKWFVYWGDERFLTNGSPERNETMARNTLLNHVAIPDEQLYPINTQHSVLETAKLYQTTLCNTKMDVCILGLGEDGHIASLFPENFNNEHALTEDVIAVTNSPKPPSLRVSVSYQYIQKAHEVIIITRKEGKEQALENILNLQISPASYICTRREVKVFVLDETEKK